MIMGINWTIISAVLLIYIIYYLSTNYETLEDWLKIVYFVVIPFLSLNVIHGVWKYYKEKNKPKPICEYCGYVALDEKELHNHQITCEKKNEKNS